jgi:hypothetical protein
MKLLLILRLVGTSAALGVGRKIRDFRRNACQRRNCWGGDERSARRRNMTRNVMNSGRLAAAG